MGDDERSDTGAKRLAAMAREHGRADLSLGRAGRVVVYTRAPIAFFPERPVRRWYVAVRLPPETCGAEWARLVQAVAEADAIVRELEALGIVDGAEVGPWRRTCCRCW